jgi:hypothetical protein
VHWLTRRAERVDLCAVMNGQRSEEHPFAGHMQRVIVGLNHDNSVAHVSCVSMVWLPAP